MIIGITSFLAAGKGTVSEYLKEKGFVVYSCSDIIREECRKNNIELTRDNLQEMGNKLREQFGANVLAERLAKKIKNEDHNYFVVESIRTPAEIEELKKLDNFYLTFIDADVEIRYNRAKERLREKEHISTIEEFKNSEAKEMKSNDPNSQQLLKCKELSDYTISNNNTIDDLKKEVDKLLLKIQIDNRIKPDWNTYFLDMAKEVSKRSNCLCVNIGAVIVKDNVILSTGYVGAPRGTKDCYQRGYCIRRKLKVPSGQRYELCASVHAEQNAIINAARTGHSIYEADMYIFGEKMFQGLVQPLDAFPCFICKKMIVNAGIKRVISSTKDGKYKIFNVNDWVEDWKEKDIIDDKEKYNTNYK